MHKRALSMYRFVLFFFCRRGARRRAKDVFYVYNNCNCALNCQSYLIWSVWLRDICTTRFLSIAAWLMIIFNKPSSKWYDYMIRFFQIAKTGPEPLSCYVGDPLCWPQSYHTHTHRHLACWLGALITPVLFAVCVCVCADEIDTFRGRRVSTLSATAEMIYTFHGRPSHQEGGHSKTATSRGSIL